MRSNVVIIEPNSAGVKLIDASLSLNHNVYILTYDKDDRMVPKHYFNQCEILQVDTNDECAMLNKLISLNSIIPIHAILPGFEYYVPASSRLNSFFKLHGLPSSTVEAMRYKHKMREYLAACGIKMPWFVVINQLKDIIKYKNKIHYPCVIKPSHLAGSLHIVKINCFEELEWNLSCLFNDPFLDLGRPMAGEVVIEEYLTGKEFSVEGYVDHKKIHFISITDKFLGEEPHFVETKHIVMANITHEIKKILLDYASSVISVLDISLGAFHCEMRLTGHSPVLIEIAARLVGDNISELIELATGISLAEKMVKSYLGWSFEENASSDLSADLKQYAGIQFIYAKHLAGASFSHIDGIEQASSIRGFNWFGLLMEPGTIIPPVVDYRARIAEVIFTGPTYESVQSSLALANDLFQVRAGRPPGK